VSYLVQNATGIIYFHSHVGTHHMHLTSPTHVQRISTRTQSVAPGQGSRVSEGGAAQGGSIREVAQAEVKDGGVAS